MTQMLRCFALALTLPLTAIDAQETPTIPPGTRVRLTNAEGWHYVRVVGTLESIDSAIPRHGTWLDVSAGPGMCSPDGRGTCVAIGSLGGAGLGVLAGFISTQSQGGASTCECGIVYALTVPAGALVGTIVGAEVGGEHWKSAPLPARLSVGAESSGRFAVDLSLRF